MPAATFETPSLTDALVPDPAIITAPKPPDVPAVPLAPAAPVAPEVPVEPDTPEVPAGLIPLIRHAYV